MIEGTVNDYLEAVVRLSLRGPTGQTQEIEAVIDTGFPAYQPDAKVRTIAKSPRNLFRSS